MVPLGTDLRHSAPARKRRLTTHIGHTAAEIARPTAAIRSITATALPRKHSFDASQPAASTRCTTETPQPAVLAVFKMPMPSGRSLRIRSSVSLREGRLKEKLTAADGPER